MTGRVVRIERVSPRGCVEVPEVTAKGLRLGDPAFGSVKHHAKNSVYVETLEDAAALVERGFSLWMGAPGKRPSLISPNSLRIIRAGMP